MPWTSFPPWEQVGDIYATGMLLPPVSTTDLSTESLGEQGAYRGMFLSAEDGEWTNVHYDRTVLPDPIEMEYVCDPRK